MVKPQMVIFIYLGARDTTQVKDEWIVQPKFLRNRNKDYEK